MVDFGNTIFEGALTPEVAQQSPVQDNSGAVLAESLGGAFQTAGQMAGGFIKSQMEAPGVAALNKYRMEVARINRAVVQENMKPREAHMLLNNLYTSTLSAHPGLGEDLDKLHSTLVGSNGIGSLIKTGSEDYQLQRKVYEDAVTNFWVDPNADEATQNEQMGDMARAKIAANRVKVLQDRLSGIQAANGIVTEQQKFEADQAIKELSSAGMTVATNRMNAAIQASYQPGANKAQIVSDLRASINTELANIGLTSLGGDYKYIEDAYTRLLNVAEDRILGKTTAEVAEAEIKRIKANANLSILADPERAAFIAASELLGHGPVVQSAMNQLAVKLFGDLISGKINPTTGRPSKSADLVGSEQEIRTATKAFIDGLEANTKAGPLSEKAAQEAQAGYINMLRNWSERAGEANTAVDFVPLVEALANSVVGDVAVTAGGVPADTRTAALAAMRQYYGEELIPLVREQINSDPEVTVFPGGQQSHLTSPLNLGDSETFKQSAAIEMIWNGAGVEFVPTSEFASNPTIRARVRALNEGSHSVAGPLNTYIRAMAHANGDKNYEQIWNEEVMPRVFPQGMGEGESKASGSLDDFTSSPSEGTGEFVEPTSNPDVNPAVLERWGGKRLPVSIRNNNPAAISIVGDIDDSFAAAQPGFVGVTKRPANEGGYYAKYATPEDGLRAASVLLQNYGRRGINTPDAIVKRWSTDKSAHNSYANTLVKYLSEIGVNVDKTTPLDLNNSAVRAAILKAKSAHESGAGVPVYNDDVYNRV